MIDITAHSMCCNINSLWKEHPKVVSSGVPHTSLFVNLFIHIVFGVKLKVSALQAYLFGPPRVTTDHQLIVIQRRKTLALFAYLAVTAQVHSRDTLATIFWPENDQVSARANLRRDISRLKQTLGENSLSLDGSNVSWNPEAGLWVDVKTYESKIAEATSHDHSTGSICLDCAAALTDAVNLYTDSFMAGFSLLDSPGFDDWQFFQAESLRHSLSDALQKLTDWHTAKKDFEQAIAYTRRWLSLDHLHEPAHRALIQLYAWSGQQSASLRQYQECLRILHEELGMEPAAETRSIYEAVKARTLAFPRSIGDDRVVTLESRVTPIDNKSGQENQFGQEIRFCTAPDGVRLAYAVVGQGPVLVKAANWLSHLEYDWKSPVWRHWLTGLARNNTLVRYDERGCGFSDWNVNEFTLDAWVLDLESVVDALSLERFPLLGISQGASIAIEYAFRHPEKISRLILYGGYLRGRLHRDLSPQQQEELEVMIQLIRIGWGKEHPAFRQVFSSLFLPEGTPEQFHAFNELQRISSSPEIAARIVGGFQNLNVREKAARISQPTLVLHARGDLRIPFEEGRLMAATIPNARLVTLESNNHILLEHEPAWKIFLDEVNTFLADGK
jgi:DNA-binding SARP family transcriptional activator/alpha-beta hydrolase superfamily lysophospholipase